jgi:hypothetical protein
MPFLDLSGLVDNYFGADLGLVFIFDLKPR